MEGENNQEIPKLCVSGCGFFGHQIFAGQCSKCFKEQSDKLSIKQQSQVKDKSEHLSDIFDNKCHVKNIEINKISENEEKTDENNEYSDKTEIIDVSEIKEENKEESKKKNRCSLCKKKVGLLGFDCRCGHQFCSLHRYAETHSCTYDYREEAQHEIRRANPVIKAKKVDKI